jgi:phenylacetate-CoA ligase
MDAWTLAKTRVEHIRNGRLSREAFKAKQLARFRRFVGYVQRRSPYYAEVIREHRIDVKKCRPEDFPIQTKQTVMENFDDLVTDRSVTKKAVSEFCAHSHDHLDLFDDRHFALHTSGSSGEVGYFVHSKADMVRGILSVLRVSPPPKLKKVQMAIAYVGALGGHFTSPTIMTAHQHSILKPFFPPTMISINDPLDEIVAQLNAAQPDLLGSYGSMLSLLAEKQLSGELNVSPSIVRNGAEPLTLQTRSLVKRAFGVDVQNLYGSTEHLLMGYGLPAYRGMYLMEDFVSYELEPDCTLVTNFANHTQPLIRYRMDDVLVPAADPDPIFPFTKVEDVVGRVEHTPIFLNRHGREDFLSPMFLVDIAIVGLRRYQFDLIDQTSFVFRMEAASGTGPEAREKLNREARDWLNKLLIQKQMDNVTFDIELVDDIPIDAKSGKFKLILPPNQQSAPLVG